MNVKIGTRSYQDYKPSLSILFIPDLVTIINTYAQIRKCKNCYKDVENERNDHCGFCVYNEPCQHIITRGPRAGLPCEKIRCGSHHGKYMG